jgi:hypothetical protein
METPEPVEEVMPEPEPPSTVRLRNSPPVPLIIGEHAQARQGQRLVSIDDIVATIEFPSRTGLPTQPGRKRVARSERGRETQVVYKEMEDGSIYVVTVFRCP